MQKYLKKKNESVFKTRTLSINKQNEVNEKKMQSDKKIKEEKQGKNCEAKYRKKAVYACETN